MKSNGKDVETKQSNHRKGAHRVRNWWMIPVVAMLASPAPSWSQFKEPVLTEITSGGDVEWGANFSGDMLEVVWVADQFRDGNSLWDIWWSRRESIDAPWEDPELLDVVNTDREENSPHLSFDGLTLTFASNRRDGGYGGLDLWQTTRMSRDDPWQEPVNMGPTINTRRNEGNATFLMDGLEVIFDSSCVGGCSPSRLRRSTRDTLADEWTTPEEMTSSGRGDQVGSVAHPSLSPDGLSLYFNAPGSFGNWDVFVSRRPSLDASFGERENVGEPVSTSGRDTGARIAPDGSLYYGHNWSGGNLRIWRAEAETPTNLIFLNAGDADQDLDFDQLDLVQVQVAAKYLTGEAAIWGEGDWDGAPGGQVGNPPAGDGLFNQFDIIAAQQANVYLNGPYAAIQPGGKKADGQTSLVYDAATGELAVDAPSGQELTSINVTSGAGKFIGVKPAVLDGAFDNFAADNVFKATFGGSFGSISFGGVLPAGITEESLAADLSVVGSLAGGGDLGDVDLVYVPEPASGLMLVFGLMACFFHFRKTKD